MTSFPPKLKDPRTCRVFVSSPFGGLEREREELVARYFPQLAALCQARGVQFVAVDMRWGITEEAATNNQVVNICLREIDRSDIFIGFYAQRYGWHGVKDDGLQQNIDLCIKRYPWLSKVRDRSVTEFEFFHGHLNKPGSLPAAFAFRAKEYDDRERAEAKRKGEEAAERKYVAESEEAKTRLADLVTRVVKTKAKCLAVHVNYETPEEAARLLFEDLKGHMDRVLLKDSVAQTPRVMELACHDAYMANRTSLFVGGQAYIKQLDATLQKGGGHLVVGPAGSGKGALVSNWLTAVRKKKSHELVYHFVGCSKDSTSVAGILQRLTEELERVAGEVKKKRSLEETGEGEEEAKPLELSDLFQQLEVALGKAAKKRKVVVVIDGVNRVQPLSRISKTLFWLPVELPPKSVTIVVTCRHDSTDVIDELTERGYSITRMQPLTEQQKKEFCVGFLQQHSKELSPSQLKTILDAPQAENPLFLNIALAELCSFGNFRMLDSKISSLVQCSSVAELFEQFLVRLEEDHNGDSGSAKTLIQQVMSGLALAKKGLMESEIQDMINIPSAAWSPLYFAIKDFILDHSGLLRLAFQELKEAVHKRYMSTKADKDKYLRPMIHYFQNQRKSFPVMVEVESVAVGRVAAELTWLLRCLGDKDALVDVLADVTVFARLFMDEEYELVELWQSTGLGQEEIVTLYLKSIETRRKLYLQEASKDTTDAHQVIDVFVLSYLDALTYFLELNHFTTTVQAVLKQRLAILERLKGSKMNEDRRQRMLGMVKIKLSYIYAGQGNFPQAQGLLEAVLDYRKQWVERSKGPEALTAIKDLAGCYHAMGLLFSKMNQMDQAVHHYTQSMTLHEKLNRPVELADSMNNLGVTLMKTGDYSRAAQLCTKALKIYEEQYFGHLPPVIGVMTGNIAVCYRNLDRLEESEAMYKKAVDIAERALGRNHPNVATALNNLGTLEVNRDQFHKAVQYFKDAMDIYKTSQSCLIGNDLFKTQEKYIYALIKVGQHAEALEAFWELYEQAQKGEATLWQVMWGEVMSLLMAQGPSQAPKVAEVALFVMTRAGPSDVMLTFLDRADRASKTTVKRPAEFTVQHALQQKPGSQLLLAYQAQEVLIPEGKTEELLALLERSGKALGAGSDLYHAAMGWCRNKQKDDMAFHILKHASDKFPDNVNFSSQICVKLREEEKFEEALPYAKRMLSAQPEDVNLLLFVGEFFIQNADLDKATEVFTKATKLAKPGSNEHKQASSGLQIVSMMAKRKASLQATGGK
ncbi:TPR repeat-containing protein DDB_G0287407-like [Babylonia areolata]|uniref:TPR repeat-containing protein DDB_G0287407-like n=1 Tax=Babylonia areolata TaxID=304850 RepID=UPI003FD5FDD1